MNAFTHKPKDRELKAAFIHPLLNKELYDRIWATARTQPWWEDGLGLVGGSEETGRFYFQKWGVTTGFAMVEVPKTIH